MVFIGKVSPATYSPIVALLVNERCRHRNSIDILLLTNKRKYLSNSVQEKSDTLMVTGSTFISSHYQGTLFRIDETSGTIYKQTNYNDDNDTSTWFSYPYALAGGGYRVFMNNTYSFTCAGQHFAFMYIRPNDSVAAYVRSNVPAGNTINTFGSIVPTPDGGTLFAEVGDT